MPTLYVTHPRYVEHDLPEHPEHAGRIRAVWARLEKDGLLPRLQMLEAKPASKEAILAVHTPEYLELLEEISAQNDTVRLDADTYLTPTSYEIAQLSAGGVIQAVEAVVKGEADNAIAVVRPPGHHAIGEQGMGFCLLSNVAIAARYAHQVLGLARVLVVDYDVHHGNGTEAVLYDDPSVFFISTHQAPLYPGTGAIEDTGEGEGKGFTLNIPLPSGHGDATFTKIFEEIIWKAAERYQPQLIIVSAGFDAHWADPLAGTNLTLAGFDRINSELVKMADQLCGGKIVFAMEGGYNLEVMAAGWANIARMLLGDAQPIDTLGEARGVHSAEEISPLIKRIKNVHKLD